MKHRIPLAALGLILSARLHGQTFSNEADFQAAISSDPGQFNNPFNFYGASFSGGSPTTSYNLSSPVLLGYHGDNYMMGLERLDITFTSGNVRAFGGHFFATLSQFGIFGPRVMRLEYSDSTVDIFQSSSQGQFRGYVAASPLAWVKITVPNSPDVTPSLDNLITAALNPSSVNVTGSLSLNDTVFGAAFGRTISFTVKQGATMISTGSTNQSLPTADYLIAVPASATGPATIEWNGSSFLRRVTPITLTGSAVSVAPVALLNGDVDESGEVDAADIDQVITDFGVTSDDNSDVDVSGEVDAADIDIVIANFGSVDE